MLSYCQVKSRAFNLCLGPCHGLHDSYVIMPKDYKFEFPDVTARSASDVKQEKEAEGEVELAKKQYIKYQKGAKRGVPSFFGL